MPRPNRVVINETGKATNPKHVIVFIRGDGWKLGAPRKWEHVAYAMWKKEWIAFQREGDNQQTDIGDYKERNTAE